MILEKYCILGQALLQKITLTLPSKSKYTCQQTEAMSTLFHIYIDIQFKLLSKSDVLNGPVENKMKYALSLCAIKYHSMSMKKALYGDNISET